MKFHQLRIGYIFIYEDKHYTKVKNVMAQEADSPK